MDSGLPPSCRWHSAPFVPSAGHARPTMQLTLGITVVNFADHCTRSYFGCLAVGAVFNGGRLSHVESCDSRTSSDGRGLESCVSSHIHSSIDSAWRKISCAISIPIPSVNQTKNDRAGPCPCPCPCLCSSLLLLPSRSCACSHRARAASVVRLSGQRCVGQRQPSQDSQINN